MKLLIAGGAVLGILGGVGVYVMMRRRRKHFEVAGSMNVGAVDEVELGGPGRSLRADAEPSLFDPEEVPSEHSEINDLRRESLHGVMP